MEQISDDRIDAEYELFVSSMEALKNNREAAIDKKAGQRQVRLIDGNYANRGRVLAHCRIGIHRGYLTKNLMESHDCLGKKCRFFKKVNEENWRSIEGNERAKAARRLLVKQAKKKKSSRDKLIKEILEDSGHIHVTSIRETDSGKIIVSYIRDKKVDLFPGMLFLMRTIGKRIEVRHRNTSDEVIEALIRKPRRKTQKVTDLRKAPKVGDATKKRLASLGVYCLEDLFGRSGEALYEKDCKLSGTNVNRRYLTAYCSAVEYANTMLD